jgi:hypothetical protein
MPLVPYPAFDDSRMNRTVLIVLKSGSLNLLEPSGPVKACNGTALPFTVGMLGGGGRRSSKLELRSFAENELRDIRNARN